MQCAGDRIGCRGRQHRHREQPGRDDAEREQREGEVAGEGPQRLGGLGRRLSPR